MTRSLLLALAFSGLALSLVAQGAPGKDKVKLARKTSKGDRLQVKEQQHTETTYHWKGEGEGSANGAEVEDVVREYFQEVVKEDPLLLKRDYATSLRTKGNPKDDKLAPVRTSVHGKTVYIGPDGPRIEGAEISKEDKENLTSIERIAYACLPRDEVSVGDTWKLGDEIGKALFGPGFDPQNFKTQGTGRLDAVKTINGRRTARLSLKTLIQVSPTEVLPSIRLELAGQAQFLIDDGVFSDVLLEGPMRTEVEKTENGHKRTMSGEAVTSYKTHAEVAAGAPPPPAPKPLAKDDELARAEALECPAGHKFPNHFLFCGQCGKELDKGTHRCPGGCLPLLRFCPLCGQGLVPAK